MKIILTHLLGTQYRSYDDKIIFNRPASTAAKSYQKYRDNENDNYFRTTSPLKRESHPILEKFCITKTTTTTTTTKNVREMTLFNVVMLKYSADALKNVILHFDVQNKESVLKFNICYHLPHGKNAESHNTSINCLEETTALSNVIRHFNKFFFRKIVYINSHIFTSIKIILTHLLPRTSVFFLYNVSNRFKNLNNFTFKILVQ